MFEYFLFRYTTAFIMFALIGFMVAGCGYTRNSTTLASGATTSGINQKGSDIGTWNRKPQGGSDEKSNSTPTEPTN